MSWYGDTISFGAYLADSLDHAVGGDSHLASSAETTFDPALNSIASQTDANGNPTAQAQDLSSDVQGSEDQTIKELPQDVSDEVKKVAHRAIDGLGPALKWIPWALGGAALIAAVAAVGYTARAFK